MKASDVPEQAILDYLAEHQPCTWWKGAERSVHNAAPEFPEKVILAKMKSLIKRGLVDGCACGCSGDFWLKDGFVQWCHEENARLFRQRAGVDKVGKTQ